MNDLPLDEVDSDSTVDGEAAEQDGRAQQLARKEALNVEKLQRETDKLALEKDVLQKQSRNFDLQSLQLGNQYFRERLRSLLDISLALLAIFVVTILIREIWVAWHDETVVISPFQVAPALEATGASGTVVASHLLDHLEDLQTATRASQSKRRVKDAWSNELKIQIPQARITIADLQNYLRDLLGNPIHIGGSLIQTVDEHGKDTIALTVRGTGFPAKTFTGTPPELTQLLNNAAEYVYSESEPYLFGVYLATSGRVDEAAALAREKFPTVIDSDKPLLLNLWGNYLGGKGDHRGAIEKYREAIALQPDFWIGYVNMVSDQTAMGDDEAAFRTGVEMEKHAHRGSWWYALLPDHFAPKVKPVWWVNLDGQRMNLPLSHAAKIQDMKEHGPRGSSVVPMIAWDAQDLVGMHDLRAAELQLQSSPGADVDPVVIAESLYVRAQAALDLEDSAGAAAKLQELDKMLAGDADLAANFDGYPAYLALANELSGQPGQVDADIARAGQLLDVVRIQGDIADHRGHWQEAQKIYAGAIARAPSLPSVYESLGEALARHEDYTGAIAQFAAANERGPNWADPLEHWGEALAAKGSHKEAIRKYRAAAKSAPNWGALHLHWGISLEKLGKHSEAMEQWRVAQSLPLSDRNKTALARLLGAVNP